MHRRRVGAWIVTGLLGCWAAGALASDPAAPESSEPAASESPTAEPSTARRILTAPVKVITAPIGVGRQLLRVVGRSGRGDATWAGDFDAMVKRRLIRALVVYSKTQYFVHNGAQRGTSYEMLKAFEDEINRELGRKRLKVHVAFLPTSREDLIPALVEGRGDIAVATLTITPERQQRIDFSAPLARGVAEIAVTGPRSPTLASVEDLAGQEVFVRRSSSYWTHMEALSARFASEGRPPIALRAAPEDLEDEDLLEMLNAGLFGIAVVDGYKAELWAKIFPDIRPRRDVAVHTGSEIAWAFRKGSPGLRAQIDAFVRTHAQGTAFGNTVIKRYTASTRFIERSTSPEETAKFLRLIEIFRRYGDRYELDYLLMMAQGYQESRLDHSARNSVGAIGVMQIMPATGRELGVGDVHELEPNIHGGVKYIRQLVDKYYANEPMDDVNKMLFAFGAYNAGPGRIRGLRREAERRKLNPDVWFNNVEVVAAEKIGSETVTYVSNIYKYYVAYKLLSEDMERRRQARDAFQKGG
jgi:membrane-bound lytic murein transglycosylase MltF